MLVPLNMIFLFKIFQFKGTNFDKKTTEPDYKDYRLQSQVTKSIFPSVGQLGKVSVLKSIIKFIKVLFLM